MVTVNTDAPTLNITFREVLSRDTIRENNEREDNPDPKEKALLDQFPGGKGIKDVIELIKKDRMDAMAEAKHAQATCERAFRDMIPSSNTKDTRLSWIHLSYIVLIMVIIILKEV